MESGLRDTGYRNRNGKESSGLFSLLAGKDLVGDEDSTGRPCPLPPVFEILLEDEDDGLALSQPDLVLALAEICLVLDAISSLLESST
jgi:hypothetical protein